MTRTARLLFIGAAAGLVLALLAGVLIGRAVQHQAYERLRLDLERLAADAASLPPVPADLEGPAADVQRTRTRSAFVRSTARWLGARVTWIAADGRVLADSEVADERLAGVENHKDRPEVLAAHAQGVGMDRRTSATVGRRYVYVAREFALPREAGQILRVALPEEELERVRRPYGRDVLALGLLGGVLAGGVVAAAQRRRDHDVAVLAEAVQAVARGGALPFPASSRGSLPADLARVESQLAEVARRAAAAERGDEGIRLLSRIVFDELPEGLLVVDTGLHVLDANDAARRLLSLAELPKGAGLLEVVRSVVVHAAFRDALARREGVEVSVTMLGEDGADRTLEIAVRPIPGAHGAGAPAAVGLIRDVSVREKVETMRRQFVADVSHELRTPVAAIRAAAETVEAEQGYSPDVARLLSIVSRQARHMEELVSDLTDLSQIETGSITLNLEPRSAKDLLTGVLRDIAPAADAKGVELKLEVVAGDVALVGDARRLAQVFRNLVDNAVKFSPPGSAVTVCARNGPAGEAVVSVNDRGCGMPRADLPKIFQRFYRVDPSRAKSVPGTGLGLAIVKHLLILHGGKIDVDSELGRGSTFTVTLPPRTLDAG